MPKSTLKMSLLRRVQSRKNTRVFMRKDFTNLGDYAQVGRALKELVSDGKLVKIGYGLYARAAKSSLTGAPIPAEPLSVLGFESLVRLGVNPETSAAAKEYRAGKTTQIPAKTKFNVGNSRITRKIGFGKTKIAYERTSG